MADWTRQRQERSGSYLFCGSLFCTAQVEQELSRCEILSIYHDVRAFAENKEGIDYLQVYNDEQGRKLFFIDQLNKEMIESGHFENEHNHCTLMFSWEY
jgi:hypothetical protein